LGIKLVVKEFRRENIKKVRFQPSVFYYSQKTHGEEQLGLRINEVINGQKFKIKDSPVVEYDQAKSQYKFPILQFKSDKLQEGTI